MGDLTSFGSSLDELFRRLGMPDPTVMNRIGDDWDALVGPPWAGRSKPLFIQGKTLIVEASAPSTVAFLRYAVSDLIATIETHLGAGIIDQVEVRPPATR